MKMLRNGFLECKLKLKLKLVSFRLSVDCFLLKHKSYMLHVLHFETNFLLENNKQLIRPKSLYQVQKSIPKDYKRKITKRIES